MWTRAGFVMLAVLPILLLEGRAVPHHRRRGQGITRLHNVTLSNTTVPRSGGELQLEGYQIDRFGRELFDLLANTVSLTLRGGRILTVAFPSHNLDTLQIQATELESFELEDVPLPNLRVLQITRNALKRIPPRMAQLVGLRQLDLSQNRLTHVSLDVFEPMRHLRDLDLSVNRIVRIEGSRARGEDAPGQPLPVRNLWVSYNRLETFEVFPAAFPALDTVRLSGNAWTCGWVDWARAEILRAGITVFGADYDCTGERRGGLCCYEGTRATSTIEPLGGAETMLEVTTKASNGTIGVQFGDVEIFF